MHLKSGYCTKCPQEMGEQLLIAGLCRYHYWGTRREESYLAAGKYIYGGMWGNVQFNRHQSKRSEEERAQLHEWFEFHDKKFPVCDNCNKDLPFFSQQVRWSHQAHILPKEIFKSVAFH